MAVCTSYYLLEREEEHGLTFQKYYSTTVLLDDGKVLELRGWCKNVFTFSIKLPLSSLNSIFPGNLCFPAPFQAVSLFSPLVQFPFPLLAGITCRIQAFNISSKRQDWAPPILCIIGGAFNKSECNFPEQKTSISHVNNDSLLQTVLAFSYYQHFYSISLCNQRDSPKGMRRP